MPGGVDLLIVGFSCVDGSNLNPKKKGLTEVGESGDTLRAVLRYAKKYRPKMILLENVASQSWGTTQAYMTNDWTDPAVDLDHLQEIWGNDDPDSAYSCNASFCDTKDYYIPQTRTRGYMLCVDRSVIGREAADLLVVRWSFIFAKVLPRRASSPFQDFLMRDDDPRMINLRQNLGQDAYGELKKRSARIWVQCRDRYFIYAIKNNLIAEDDPHSSPLCHTTVEGGPTFPPEFFAKAFMKFQPARVILHIDHCYLRAAKTGFDALYKS